MLMSIRVNGRCLALGLFVGLCALPAVGRADPPADERERQQQEIKRLQAQLDEAKKKLAEQEKEVAALREVKRLRDLLEESNKKVVQLQQEAARERDRATAAQIEAAALKQRNDQLVVELEKVTRELRKAREERQPAPPPKNPPKNPPPDEVEGLVKEVTKDGLVRLSIGSDAGLLKGHTLEVFRLKPAALYLGSLRIIDVKPTEAVGQLIGPARGQVEVGDHVSSRINLPAKP
jgi:hypothetical protein